MMKKCKYLIIEFYIYFFQFSLCIFIMHNVFCQTYNMGTSLSKSLSASVWQKTLPKLLQTKHLFLPRYLAFHSLQVDMHSMSINLSITTPHCKISYWILWLHLLKIHEIFNFSSSPLSWSLLCMGYNNTFINGFLCSNWISFSMSPLSDF